MSTRIFYTSLLLIMFSSFASAGETSKGTIIMMSSVGGWIVATTGFILYKEAKRMRRERSMKKDVE